MATLIDVPSFTNDEVYELQSTDAVEGAAVGASFGGIGLSNQPHQQLANRTRFLKNRQDTNITNIAALQAFAGKFRSLMRMPGYFQADATDDVFGDLQPIVNFGFYSFTSPQLRAVDVENKPFAVAFAKPFSSVCLAAWGTFGSNSAAGAGALSSCALQLETLSNTLSKTGCSFFTDFNAQSGAIIYIANPSTGRLGLTGFFWLAIGF